MTKSTITREHLQEMLEWCEVFRRHPRLDDIAEAIRMALAAMDQKPALHRYRRKSVEPYGPYPWHYEAFVNFDRPLEGIEDEYFYAAPPVVTGFAVDSEPVAWLLSGGGAKNVVCFDSGNAYADPLREVTPLYRHAQQPVVLDGFSVERLEMLADRLTARITSLEIHERTGNISSTQQETLDAFRIALEVLELKQAQPAAPQLPGSEPATVPGKWIPVSERMPEDEQEVLTINKMGHRFVSFFDKHSGLFFDRLDAPAACCIEHVLVTHWMPLPAAPQEVK